MRRMPKKGDIVYDDGWWYGLLIKDGAIVNGNLICTVLVLRRDRFQEQVGTIAEWKLAFPFSIL